MKRQIRIGEGYALSKHKLNQFNMRYISLLTVLTIMCLYAQGQVSDGASVPVPNGQLTVPEGGVIIGDELPEAFWDLKLKVVNHPEGTDSITLRDYKGSKLLVLDFWATWCKPCVISVDKWEKKLDSIPEMSFVPVHMDFEEKALPFILKRGWKSPSVVGEERKLLNKLFFKEPRITRSVWILDGRFVAVTGYNGPDATTILDVIHSGRSIPSLTESLYSPLY